MKLFAAILCAGIATISAGCGSTATAPTTVTLPSSYTFTASLLPSNEVPAVTNADASGSGTATLTMNVTRDSSGGVTAATMNFTVNMSGFPAGTSLTGAHIHQAGPGVSSGVSVSTGLASGEVVLANGSGSFTKSNINVAVDTANLLISGANGFYFNIHTTLNPGGAARGQLNKQ
jgi:hypothetical protein